MLVMRFSYMAFIVLSSLPLAFIISPFLMILALVCSSFSRAMSCKVKFVFENFLFRWRHLLLEISLLYKFCVSCKFRYILPRFLFVYQIFFDFSFSFHFSSLAVQVHINFCDIVSSHDLLSGHLMPFVFTKFLSLTQDFQESYNAIDFFLFKLEHACFHIKTMTGF